MPQASSALANAVRKAGNRPGLALFDLRLAQREQLEQDMRYLARLWEVIQQRQRTAEVPSLIFDELPLPQRIIRDLAGEQTTKIYVDSREIHLKVKQFVEEFVL